MNRLVVIWVNCQMTAEVIIHSGKPLKKLKRPILQNPPIRNANGSWAKSNEQKANRFAEHLERTFQPNEGDHELEWENIVQQVSEIKLTSPKEVAAEIKKALTQRNHQGMT